MTIDWKIPNGVGPVAEAALYGGIRDDRVEVHDKELIEEGLIPPRNILGIKRANKILQSVRPPRPGAERYADRFYAQVRELLLGQGTLSNVIAAARVEMGLGGHIPAIPSPTHQAASDRLD